ncbi:MAG: ABC transporter permease [Fimbriimonadaceae bacterium]
MDALMLAIAVLHFAAPVAFAAVGEAVAQRSGVINIGLEGVMLVACYFAMLGSATTGSPWLGMLFGVLAALALGVVQSFFTLRLAADQIVVGTAVNLFALGLTDTLFRARFGQTGSLISVERVPKLFGDLDVVLLLLLACAAYFAWFLAKTKRGLVVRAAGEYPDAVEAAGFSAISARFWCTIVGAALAGLGGAYLAVGVTGSFASGMTMGRGFLAIAIVTFGRWRPAWVLAAALLVGYSESVQYTLQARDLQVPGELLQALPHLVALGVLVLVGRGTAMPAMLAVPYRRDK